MAPKRPAQNNDEEAHVVSAYNFQSSSLHYSGFCRTTALSLIDENIDRRAPLSIMMVNPPRDRSLRDAPCHRCVNMLRSPRFAGTHVSCVWDTRTNVRIRRCLRCIDHRRPCSQVSLDNQFPGAGQLIMWQVPAKYRDEALAIMAMNAAIFAGDADAPSKLEVQTRAGVLSGRLGKLPEYSNLRKSHGKQQSRAVRAVGLIGEEPQNGTKPAIVDVVQVKHEAMSTSPEPVQQQGHQRRQNSSASDEADPIAAFLNARPVHDTNVDHGGEGDDDDDRDYRREQTTEPSTKVVLTMILDALRQGVEIYARAVSHPFVAVFSHLTSSERPTAASVAQPVRRLAVNSHSKDVQNY